MSTDRTEKLLRLLGSDNEAEAMNALRFLRTLKKKAGLRWNEFVDQLMHGANGPARADISLRAELVNLVKENSRLKRALHTATRELEQAHRAIQTGTDFRSFVDAEEYERAQKVNETMAAEMDRQIWEEQRRDKSKTKSRWFRGF